MRALIIGASKGIGLETTRQALAAGHHVRAFARSADGLAMRHPSLEAFRGDALNPGDVEAALAGVDVVIEALGVGFKDLFRPVRLFSDATRILVPAMERKAIRRLIAVTGFGAGDSHDALGMVEAVPFALVFGRAYDDKSEQERLIGQSPLEWTIARPGVLTNGRRSGRYKVLADPSLWRNGVISRADVADFLVRQIEDRAYLGKAPVLVG